MAPFFTGCGDDGYTGLLGEGRIPKYDLRLETLGALDEANAALGMARSACVLTVSRNLILKIQRDLYHLMAETAASPESAAKFRRIDARHVAWLEEQIESTGRGVSMPEDFIAPGDTWAGAVVDLARAVVRRAERRMAEAFHRGDVKSPEMLIYLNRLSSLLYFIELSEIQAAGVAAPTLAKTEQDDRNLD